MKCCIYFPLKRQNIHTRLEMSPNDHFTLKRHFKCIKNGDDAFICSHKSENFDVLLLRLMVVFL